MQADQVTESRNKQNSVFRRKMGLRPNLSDILPLPFQYSITAINSILCLHFLFADK